MEQNGVKWKINGFGFPVKNYQACLPAGTAGTATPREMGTEIVVKGTRRPSRGSHPERFRPEGRLLKLVITAMGMGWFC